MSSTRGVCGAPRRRSPPSSACRPVWSRSRPALRRPVIAALMLVAGAVVVTIANPFADALLSTGLLLGIDPYFLIQSAVPVASEAPEFVVAAVLVANRRPAQGLALFLASAVSQCT